MYKKITHTIVEEHFDHPMSVNIASDVKTGHRMGRPQMIEIMPAGQFKSFVDNYFIDMEGKLVELANATFDESLDFQSALANAMDYETLGNTLGKYYGVEFQERINQNLGNGIMQLLFYWRNSIRKFDNKETLARIKNNSWAMSQIMNQYNNFWDRDIVRTQFDDFFNEFINLGNARLAKNKTTESAALDRIAAAGSKLSNYLSNGVLQNHPELFTA
jgi:predicted Zn-dependent protease with MMP-like domain